MHLLELPVDIFEKIIRDHFIESVGERNAWDARAVCHTFRNVISWIFFCRVSLDKPPPRRSLHEVLTEFYLANLLEYRAGQAVDPSDHILVFINKAADEILSIDSPDDKDDVAETRQRYVRDIIHALVDQLPISRFKWKSSQYTISGDMPPNLGLAIAAAVGSIKSVAYFLGMGAQVASLKPRAGAEMPLFDSAVQTSAVTGKHDILGILLTDITPSSSIQIQDERRHIKRVQDLLRAATTSAVYAQQEQSVKILLQFQQDNRHTPLGATPIHMHRQWLMEAARRGSLDMIRDILNFLDGSETTQRRIYQIIAKTAVRNGHEHIARHLLESDLPADMLAIGPVAGSAVPFMNTLVEDAVESNHPQTLRLVLGGMRRDVLRFSRTNTTLIYAAVTKRSLPIVKLLLQIGCTYCHHTTSRINDRAKIAMSTTYNEQHTWTSSGTHYYPPRKDMPPTPSRRQDDVLLAYVWAKKELVGGERACTPWCRKGDGKAFKGVVRFVEKSEYWREFVKGVEGEMEGVGAWGVDEGWVEKSGGCKWRRAFGGRYGVKG